MKEDLNALRMISRLLTRTHFMEQWQWRVEIDPPKGMSDKYDLFRFGVVSGVSDFDLLAKSVDFDPLTIESEPVKAGAITFNFPTVSGSSTINLTMRDAVAKDGLPRFYRFFKDIAALVFNKDGTVNLPSKYLLTLKLYLLTNDEDTEDAEMESYRVFPQKLGNFTASVDGEGLVEYPVTFMQFRSLG